VKVLPAELLEDLHEVKGFDENAFVAVHQKPAVTSVRLHPVKHNNYFAGNERINWCPTGRYLPERPTFTLDPSFHAGAYYVQEASSMFLDYLLRNLLPEKNNLRVLDLCAAPGGKSTLLASLLQPDSLLISNEVIRTRASILEENMVRWGYTNTWVASNDPRDFTKLKGYFDVIVVDAPCSGSGLFRKDEYALNEWSTANVNLCSERQQRILADIWPSLKQDGLLIYATCSYSPEEDEQILDWLSTEFEVESLSVDIPKEWGIVMVQSSQRNIVGYRFFPDKAKGEGLFVAAIRKKGMEETVKYPKVKSAVHKLIQQQVNHLVRSNDLLYLQKDKDDYFAINSAHESDFYLLQKALYLRKTGLSLGMPTAKEWLPDHSIALSIDANENLNSISINKEQALHFLKKSDLEISIPEKGWYIIKYEGLGLGWIKSLGNRINNYLPRHWRIRMEITDTDWA